MFEKKSDDQVPKGEFTSVVTKGKSGNRGPESDAAYEVHNSPSELRHLAFYYKRFLKYFHSYFLSYICLTFCDYPGLASRATGFTPKPAISPHELSDIATLRANLSYTLPLCALEPSLGDSNYFGAQRIPS